MSKFLTSQILILIERSKLLIKKSVVLSIAVLALQTGFALNMTISKPDSVHSPSYCGTEIQVYDDKDIINWVPRGSLLKFEPGTYEVYFLDKHDKFYTIRLCGLAQYQPGDQLWSYDCQVYRHIPADSVIKTTPYYVPRLDIDGYPAGECEVTFDNRPN
jgi:hypothetical protein